MASTPLRARFDAAMNTLPLIAILRGVRPDEAEAIGAVLHAAGFRLVEVPLNSPQPFDSIARLRRSLPADTVVGAGTVLASTEVARLHDAGGELAVMPHADVEVVAAAKAAGLVCVPGIATPTEAFAALRAGADALKLFPAEMLTPPVLKALRAVLPHDVALLPVGGITPVNMRSYRDAGASGFGLGSALYSPGATVDDVARRAQAFVEAWRF
jgi:2-dehydro-3-deoxyphosphogalactonate aldolase